jgi:hypothetical protein
MDFTHYSVTSLVAFTVNTQVVLSAELFAIDLTIGATGNFMDDWYLMPGMSLKALTFW